MHHIVTDGWSYGVAAGELATLYEAFRRGEPSPLPALPIQYADYAAWQREWLRGDVLDELLGYWKGRLTDAPDLELPTDRPRPAVRSPRGASKDFALPRDLSRALVELSRREDATLFMTLLAAFQVLLAKYSGQDDVVVGSPAANRGRAEARGAHRLFRQHARAPDRPLRRSDLRRAARPGPRGRRRRLRAPGPAARAADRGPPAPPRPEPDPALPGDVRAPEQRDARR